MPQRDVLRRWKLCGFDCEGLGDVYRSLAAARFCPVRKQMADENIYGLFRKASRQMPTHRGDVIRVSLVPSVLRIHHLADINDLVLRHPRQNSDLRQILVLLK